MGRGHRATQPRGSRHRIRRPSRRPYKRRRFRSYINDSAEISGARRCPLLGGNADMPFRRGHFRPCVPRGFVELASAVLHQCIRPLIGAYAAPGHHGYQRASDLISGQASTGDLGHQRSHTPGRPILHLVSSSRRPRRVRGVYQTAPLPMKFPRTQNADPKIAGPSHERLSHRTRDPFKSGPLI